MPLPDSAPLPLDHPLRDRETPADIQVRAEPRVPVFDPTLGVAVRLDPAGAGPPPPHRLVTLGDSLTHGFQSFAIWNTPLSYPALVARALGIFDTFRYPSYEQGGLPLNLERLVRYLEQRYGPRIDWWELAPAALELRAFLDRVEDYWERGPGAQPPPFTAIMHNLGIYGWDLRDALSKDAAWCLARIRAAPPRDNLLAPFIQHPNEIAALRVLPPAEGGGRSLSTVEAAEALSREGQPGIETLIVALGSNNALGTMVHLKVAWSEAPAYRDLDGKEAFTIWRPEHFRTELSELELAVRRIRARHAIWTTVPHVTIVPLGRGVGGAKARPGSRYFPYYTYAWIADSEFDPRVDPHLTENQARAIDSTIDDYNQALEQLVRQARLAGRDWYLFDLAGLLDRLAFRRYIQDRRAQPAWWSEYPLPAPLASLDPRPDSRFFLSGPAGRTAGGLFALDGVHPTTIGYGIIAQELVRVMRLAGVAVNDIDFAQLLSQDTLMADPPRSLSSDLGLAGWIHHHADLLRMLGRGWPARQAG